MKQKFLSMLTLIFTLVNFVFTSNPAFAADDVIDLDQATKEINSYIEDENLSSTISNFTLSLRDDIDISQYSSQELDQLLKQDVSAIKELLSDLQYELVEHPQIRLSHQGGNLYTAEVWAGVPSVGWSTVKQDFRASISSGKVNSISFLGGGYMTGVSWGQYNHIRSWYNIYGNGKKVDINIKGNINYLFNLVNANYAATFVEELEVSGNILKRQW